MVSLPLLAAHRCKITSRPHLLAVTVFIRWCSWWGQFSQLPGKPTCITMQYPLGPPYRR